MQKAKKILTLLFASLLLTGCANDASGSINGGGDNASTSTDSGSSTSEGDSSSSSTSTDEVVHVTGVSLNLTKKSIEVGNTFTLTATVSPSNATNKSVSFTSSNSSVATVSNAGVVSALKEGNALITVKTVDQEKTATCSLTVTSKTSEETASSTVVINSNNTSKDGNSVSVSISSFSVTGDSLSSISAKGSNIFGSNDTSYRFSSSKNSGSLTFSFSKALISQISINASVYGKDSPSVKIVTSANSTGQTVTLDSTSKKDYDFSTFASNPAECTSITISSAKDNRFFLYSVTLTIGNLEPVYPTSISLPSTTEVMQNKTSTLTPTVLPSNYNQGTISWTSSNTSIVKVNNATLTGVAIGKATVTASIDDANGAKLTASCEVSVTELTKAAWTIMIYMCGSDLESENGFATSDIQEILSVSNKPSNVNIIIETGGAKSWKSTYGISANYLERYEVGNKKLNKVDSLTKASMGEASTFKSFMEWGLNDYPALRTGVILWNHGRALDGVCYDENYNGDYLENHETESVLKSLNLENKLEWIGYDACLMQVQDVAKVNSSYFNYMVASQESESGYGWDYDNWLPTLYSNPTTVETSAVLKSIVDSFITDNGGVNGKGDTYSFDDGNHYCPANQTLSYLNLAYMDTYFSAWENMASQLSKKVTTSNASSFRTNIICKTKYFGDSYPGEGYYSSVCVFDVQHFLNILSNNSTFKVDGISAVQNALNNLVGYSSAQTEGAKDAHGLSFFFDITKSSYYKSNSNNNYFPTWDNFWKSYCGSASSTYNYKS